MDCEHDKISYLGQMIDESAKEYLKAEMYEKFKYLDLYNCIKCHSTIAIDRRKIGELEKRIVKIEDEV